VSKIVLEVSDGIIYVVTNPDEIEIEIRDYDWPHEDLPEGQDYRLVHGTQKLEYEGLDEPAALKEASAG
jgi:hypothetical protein